MNEEIKKFNEFRVDEDGTYYYYDDKNNVEQWSYNLDNLKNYITNLQEENQKLINGIDEINECMKKYEKTSVDDVKTIISFYKQLKNILNKLAELKKRWNK